jgi:hypothetical protein
MKILQVELTDEECYDVMTTAVESGYYGIGYWAEVIQELSRDEQLNITEFICSVDENEDGNYTHYTVTPETIRKGVNKILEPDFEIRADLVQSLFPEWDIDSESADCIIQAGLFGELKFG